MNKNIPLPIISINNERWILLSTLSDSFKIRAVYISNPYEKPDPSDHCRWETTANGGVKIKVKKQWDYEEYFKKLKTKEKKVKEKEEREKKLKGKKRKRKRRNP